MLTVTAYWLGRGVFPCCALESYVMTECHADSEYWLAISGRSLNLHGQATRKSTPATVLCPVMCLPWWLLVYLLIAYHYNQIIVLHRSTVVIKCFRKFAIRFCCSCFGGTPSPGKRHARLF